MQSDVDFKNAGLTIAYGFLLAISGMLYGILVSSFVSIAISTANAILVVVAYTTVTASFQEAISPSIPIIAFIFLIALISWLYQRTLTQSFEHLSVARQQLTRDALLRQELAIARDLQSRLYPDPPETDSRLNIASVVLPALETSGDLYDFIELGPDELGIVIADVTGKSLAAALVMAMARSTFRSEARRSPNPAEVLTQVNASLCNDHSVKQMLTAWYGILNTRTLHLRYANAGHPFPILKRDGAVTELEIPGLPLRARPDTVYYEQEIVLQAGDDLLLTSDGAVETMNAQRELFGFDRFNATLQNLPPLPANAIIACLCEALETFRGLTPQNDDITLVLIQVN
jgi:serine phosphatase RsbU (regulator of sigma subunit)